LSSPSSVLASTSATANRSVCKSRSHLLIFLGDLLFSFSRSIVHPESSDPPVSPGFVVAQQSARSSRSLSLHTRLLLVSSSLAQPSETARVTPSDLSAALDPSRLPPSYPDRSPPSRPSLYVDRLYPIQVENRRQIHSTPSESVAAHVQVGLLRCVFLIPSRRQGLLLP
jgi:hypothetical protein